MRNMIVGASLVLLVGLRAFAADVPTWPTFANEASTRLVSDPSVGINDVSEKDYAWGDVDHDGDIDLVCVRKEPWNTPGRRRNVLFMNEGKAEGHQVNGVLVDRTAQYASDATDGGQGFLDLTNDRDTALVDVNADGWLDIVTATTYGQGLPKTISHPRVYINEGPIDDVWQGFRYEESRTPSMPIEPNFCSVAVGDVTGDGKPDLYFTDYNNTLEDRLWMNNGLGSFADVTLARLTNEMRESDFGVRAVIADMNGDGVADILKDRGSSASTPPLRITIAYNNPANVGFFNAFQIVYNGSPYHVDAADLNGDGRLDIVIDDDGLDRYFLNQGISPNGQAAFQNMTLPPESNSFGGNIVVRDVDKDGHPDVFIADVDVDCCGCSRSMHFWRNRGNLPNVTFEEQSGSIPISARTGTFDVAVFDINGDDWDDMVIGTCTGTSVWIAQPRLHIDYPQGTPETVVNPDHQISFPVRIQAIGGAVTNADSATLHLSLQGGAFISLPLQSAGGTNFQATIPPVQCGTRLAYYVSVATDVGVEFRDPPAAPTLSYRSIAASTLKTIFADHFEAATGGWGVSNDPSLTAGAWERAQPNSTIANGVVAAPAVDATADPGVFAFVTQNGSPGGAANLTDVDGGPTHLISPTLNLAGGDAVISYARWFHSSSGSIDSFTVSVSNDGGGSWVNVSSQTTNSTNGTWETATFIVGDFASPTADVRIRLSASDVPNDSITEAGVDEFQVDRVICAAPCPTDINGDGLVNIDDLLTVINAWGPCLNPQDCPADIAPVGPNPAGDDLVNIDDLLALINTWGECS